MILLGSIERTELQAVLDWWLSPERRVFEAGQNSPSQGSKVSWESFTFVDEEGKEEGPDKVGRGWKKYSINIQFNDYYCWSGRLLQHRRNVMALFPPPSLRNLQPTMQIQVT